MRGPNCCGEDRISLDTKADLIKVFYYCKKKDQPRTTKLNALFALSARQKSITEEKETGSSDVIFKNSGLVAPIEQISNSFVEDLKLLARLAAWFSIK